MKTTISLTEKEYARLLLNNQRLLCIYEFLDTLDNMNLRDKGNVITEGKPVVNLDIRNVIVRIKDISRYPSNKRNTWLILSHSDKPRWISLKSFMGLRISRKY